MVASVYRGFVPLSDSVFESRDSVVVSLPLSCATNQDNRMNQDSENHPEFHP